MKVMEWRMKYSARDKGKESELNCKEIESKWLDKGGGSENAFEWGTERKEWWREWTK